jgi:hypothetical protein
MYRRNGYPAVDGRGRLIYELYPVRDSSVLVGAHLTGREVDTLTRLLTQSIMAPGVRMRPVVLADAWAVLSNGSIAVVRAVDRTIEVWSLDGGHKSGALLTPAIPINAGEKRVLVEAMRGSLTPRADSSGAGQANATRRATATPITNVVDAADIPDFRSPLKAGTVLAGPNSTIWGIEDRFQSSTDSLTAIAFDGATSAGRSVARVRIPPHSTVVGFGAAALYVVGGHLMKLALPR